MDTGLIPPDKDSDASMADSSPFEILEQTLGKDWDRFVTAFVARSPHPSSSMRFLGLFAARRATACWRLYCDDTRPIDCVRAAERSVVADGSAADALLQFHEPAVPSFRGRRIYDCRACDTGCAAKTVAHMARLFSSGDPRDLALCLEYADAAFDQSPLGRRDEFRRWLIEVAVPASMDQRVLTPDESSRFRSYSDREIDDTREREAAFWNKL